ncbi:MAG: GNAT family N-acetyltransferase [Myxococcales bacterium]|nr:GNAT family N-acetyltransferase [Myxococcales bacterium]
MKVHLIGIGGTGMVALAGLLQATGHQVRGSDGPIYPPMSDQLAALEIEVTEGYAPENLDWEPDLVVVGNTCKKDNAEARAAEDRGLEISSLPRVLGELLLEGREPVVVAGTHGKTTTSSLMSHMLITAGRDPGVFVGGVPLNMGQGWRLGEGAEFVLEGDEYDSAFFDKRSKFLHYKPKYAVLTSIELDHVDIFSSMDEVRATFRKFVQLIPRDGFLMVCASSSEALAIAEACGAQVERYGLTSGAVDGDLEWSAKQVAVLPSGRCRFDVYRFGELYDRYEMLMSGRHNIENALACVGVAHLLGISRAQIVAALASFSGVARRQMFRGLAQGVTIIEDYGHHPTAIAVTLEGLHRRFAGRRLVAVYEPRTATSRRKTFQREFAEAFANADELVVGALYSPDKIAKEDRFEPERLALDVHQDGTPATCIKDVDGIVRHVTESVRPGDVVVVFSTGDFNGIFDKLLAALGDAMVPAQRHHFEPIIGLLEKLGLGVADIDEEKMSEFFALENEDGVMGCVGLEVFGEDAVLRSLAVAPAGRGIGYGWMLADTAIDMARFRGVKRLYLITAKASDFFAAKHGFRIVDLSTAPESVSGSTTFAHQSDSLVPMRLDL